MAMTVIHWSITMVVILLSMVTGHLCGRRQHRCRDLPNDGVDDCTGQRR